MRKTGQKPIIQKIARFILRIYLVLYHRFETIIPPTLPKHGPYLALTSHFSNLDVVALMVGDPYYPYTTLVVKESMMKIPIIRWVLRAWGAVPVARHGRDITALRSINQIFQEKRGICIAAEGTRNPTGHLGSMDPILIRLAVDAACKNIPVFPVVETGTYKALPKHAWLPRPYQIKVVAGDPIDLSPWCKKRLSDADLLEVATLLRNKIAALLPPEQQPLPDTPILGKPQID